MGQKIETIDNLCDNLADLIGVYGSCKSTDPNGCSNNDMCCCRVGFMIVLRGRILSAIENERLIDEHRLDIDKPYDKNILEYVKKDNE